MGEELYPRFSPQEFARRHAAARSMMAREGVDILVVYGNSSISRHNHADIHYLSGFLGNRNNYVVLPAQGEPVLFVQSRKTAQEPHTSFTFESSMCVVVQPNVVTPDERAGVQLGNLLRITETGSECLHTIPVQYFVTR